LLFLQYKETAARLVFTRRLIPWADQELQVSSEDEVAGPLLVLLGQRLKEILAQAAAAHPLQR
jgi:hypothetical protein